MVQEFSIPLPNKVSEGLRYANWSSVLHGDVKLNSVQ